MKRLLKSISLKTAALVVGITAASFAVTPASVFAAPTGCSAWKSTPTLGAAKCTGGTGQVRVKVVCWSGGINYTDYGPWVGVGTTSFQTCPGSSWMDVGYQVR